MKKQDLKIYVITTGDQGRIDRIRDQLQGLDYHFILSKPMPVLEKMEKALRSKSHKYRQKAIMAGEIGAFSTHGEAWAEIEKTGVPGVIIEDNADFISDPKFLLDPLIKNQIVECGLVSFTDFRYQANHREPFIVSSIKEKRPLPIVCYGVTPERAANLVRAIKKTSYILPVDKWLSIPELCGVYGYVSNLTLAKRKKGLASIANKKRGRKTYNPINMVFWAINKIKYGY